jgi:phosphatidylglycerol:prolipoprotein diacylglycerol transferase
MHPILFEIGPFTLRSYGLMMALGFGFGIWLSSRLNRREGRSEEMIYDLSVWIMLGAILGARLLYVAVEPEQFADGPWWDVLAVWKGGLVYYGGLLGGALSAYIWLRREKAPVWRVADCLAPGLALGQMFGRIGCYLNGCCYGYVSQRFGVVFPALAAQGDSQPHLPVELYESAYVLLLSAFLTWYMPRRRYVGEVFVLYLLFYSIGRFILEIFRGDAERGVLISGLLSPGQWLSLLGVLVAFFLYRQQRRVSL